MPSTKLSKPYDLSGRNSLYPSSPSFFRTRIARFLGIGLLLLFCAVFTHHVLAPKNLVYGLMIDAGSTGSRIHTYTFRKHTDSPLQLLHEDFHALKPGLSSYAGDPTAAAKSLLPLLERARSRVPSSVRQNTPVVLRATAGLRLTGPEASSAILTSVRNTLKSSGFRFDSDEWAEILAGNDEGIYSWITVNHLLGRGQKDSVGTLEMGGGSAQIAFVPRDSQSINAVGNCSLPAENVPFGGADVKLYTTSHLEFGLQKARALALTAFEKEGVLDANPCVNNGEKIQVKVPFDKNDKQVQLSGQGNFQKCKEMLDRFVARPAMNDKCECDYCTYHGAPQPPAIDEYVAIAFYRERTVLLGMPDQIVPGDIVKKGEEICSMSVGDVKKSFPDVRNGDPTDLCLDLSYISLHLQKGHGIAPDSQAKIMVMEKINSFELGWCLGAMQQTMSKLGLDK